MDLFNFYFTFFGLLLGLAAAEVAGGLATAVQARRKVPTVSIVSMTGVRSALGAR